MTIRGLLINFKSNNSSKDMFTNGDDCYFSFVYISSTLSLSYFLINSAKKKPTIRRMDTSLTSVLINELEAWPLIMQLSNNEDHGDVNSTSKHWHGLHVAYFFPTNFLLCYHTQISLVPFWWRKRNQNNLTIVALSKMLLTYNSCF